MRDENIPTIGHVGLIPGKATWIGGYRAIGKTAEEAIGVLKHTLELQEAGVIGVELEVVPQGTLAERIRAGGAGIPAFFTPTGVNTMIGEGKETREFNGREYLLEYSLTADFALLRGHKSDIMGNTVYRGTSQSFNAVMATAAQVTIMEVDEIVELGGIEPEGVHTPAIFVDRIVKNSKK